MSERWPDLEVDETLERLQRAVAGRYAVLRPLGQGGMGLVFLARDLSLDRPVAIKVLPDALAARGELRERFLREARTAAQLAHPNIVPIHSVEDHGRLVFFVMPFVEGETLGERVRRDGPLSTDEVFRIGQEVSWALAYAHRRGVIHRDVKPDNILLDRASGRAVVTDFGIALPSADAAAPAARIEGTPRYMSPEQSAGQALDGRSDLYSLGLVLHFALTGSLPSAGSDRLLPSRAIRAGEIVDRLLAPSPDGRFPDGEAAATALGDARGFVAPTPPAVRTTLETLRTFIHEVSSYVAIVAVLLVAILIGVAAPPGVVVTTAVAVLAVMSGLFIGRSSQLIGRIRHLLREGFDADDLWRAIEREEDAPAAAFRGRTAALTIVGGIGWAALLLAPTAGAGPVASGVVAALLALYPMVVLRGLLQRMLAPRASGWWKNFRRLFEWKFFGMAKLGLDRGARLGPERTEQALATSAREALAGLGTDRRDLVRLIDGLADRIAELRSRDDPAALARRNEAIRALESLRLALLGSDTTAPPSEALTQSIARARVLSERIDALIAARAELDRDGHSPPLQSPEADSQ